MLYYIIFIILCYIILLYYIIILYSIILYYYILFYFYYLYYTIIYIILYFIIYHALFNFFYKCVRILALFASLFFVLAYRTLTPADLILSKRNSDASSRFNSTTSDALTELSSLSFV